MKYNKIKQYLYLVGISSLLSITNACQPEDFGDGNGLTDSNLDASFTITPVAGSNNKFILKANSLSARNGWDIDNSGLVMGESTKEILLPDVGTYNVIHYAFDAVKLGPSSTQTITVTTPDPDFGNLVQGGKFANAADIAKWTILEMGTGKTKWTLENGKATITGSSWNQQGLYQAVNVTPGRTYTINMLASSTSGCSNTWFEVYVGTTMPVQNGPDYNNGGKRCSINTWAGCGKTAFSGKISAIGCSAADNTCEFTATASVMYLVIRSGGEDLKDGISITNVEIRPKA